MTGRCFTFVFQLKSYVRFLCLFSEYESSIDWLTDWFIGPLIDWSFDWSIDWLIDWLIHRSIDWLIDWMIGPLIDWSFDWLIGLSVHWLIDWLDDRSIDWLIVRLIDWPIGPLIDWLIDLIRVWIHWITTQKVRVSIWNQSRCGLEKKVAYWRFFFFHFAVDDEVLHLTS